VGKVGLTAVNDLLAMENAGYRILDKFVKDPILYKEIFQLVHDIGHKTLLGERLDLESTLEIGIERLDISIQITSL